MAFLEDGTAVDLASGSGSTALLGGVAACMAQVLESHPSAAAALFNSHCSVGVA